MSGGFGRGRPTSKKNTSMSHANLVQVYFLKPPTGDPWRLAYSVGDFGFTTRQKAKAMEAVGVVAKLNLSDESDDGGRFVPVAELETGLPDLDTVEKVEAHFSGDLSRMREYCEKEGISISAKTKRVVTFYARIVKHNSK